VREYVPLALSKKDDSIATQYTMTTLEELGLLKMDFLGLRNLTVIDDAVRDIRKTVPDFSIDEIPDDDAPTYEMLAQGKTVGVFQMESEGMTGVCVGIAAKSIDDIAAVIALYRPGPMEAIPMFIENSRDPSKIKYIDPALEPILQVTYGCIVYQEHVIEILRKLGGYSLGQADLIRRAMSKKKQSEIQKERHTFINGDAERGIPGAVANGIPRSAAGQIYDSVTPFAGYGFNKAHAVAYAVIAYQTAYLKCHYPRQYMAALISSVLGWPEKVAEYAAECREMGVALLPPDINESGAMFSVFGNNLRYGLVAVKNIGRGFINEVVAEREKNGPFTGFEEFCRRMYGGDLNRRALESLIKGGCFDGFGANRRQLMMICQTVVDSVSEHRRRNVEGQMDLFGLSGDTDNHETGGIELPDVAEYPKSDLMRMEREVTGLYLSGHPIDEYRRAASNAGAVGIGDILADFARADGNIKFADDQQVMIAGVIESVKTKPTRNNTLMAYLSLDDGSGSIELLAFQRVIDESGGYMQVSTPVLAAGRLSARDEKEPQIVLNILRPITDVVRMAEERGEFGIRNSEFGINGRGIQDGIRDGIRDGVRSGGAESGISSSESGAGDRGAGGAKERTLFVKLRNEDSPEYERLKLVHMMFPGYTRMVIHFSDTKKSVGTKCVIHDAFISELRQMLGSENVVVR